MTIAKDVKIQVELNPAEVAAYRLIGYENRMLAHRDFDDDSKDAGEIGAGHAVTALYEIVPAGDSDDLGTLRVRYKEPEGSTSEALEHELRDHGTTRIDRTSTDFRFAAAVAWFGRLLHDPDEAPAAEWAGTRSLALGAVGADPMCRRHELVQLVGTAAGLAGRPLSTTLAACTPDPSPRPPPGATRPPASSRSEAAPSEDGVTPALWLEVLHLLPPLLALPLFVMAIRDPYRRRRR